MKILIAEAQEIFRIGLRSVLDGIGNHHDGFSFVILVGFQGRASQGNRRSIGNAPLAIRETALMASQFTVPPAAWATLGQ